MHNVNVDKVSATEERSTSINSDYRQPSQNYTTESIEREQLPFPEMGFDFDDIGLILCEK